MRQFNGTALPALSDHFYLGIGQIIFHGPLELLTVMISRGRGLGR